MSITRFLRKYQNYIADNPHGHWFKRKPYGWGWTPATWQGHAVSLVVVTLFLGVVFTAPANLQGYGLLVRIVFPITTLFLGFILLLYSKGESPRWMFGIDDSYDRPVDRDRARIGRLNINVAITAIVAGCLIGLWFALRSQSV